MLIDAIGFLKGAVARSGNTPALYTFHDGWAFAQSPAILAAYPTPELQGTFALPAPQVDAALARFPAAPTISSNDDGHLVLKAGRLRTTLVPIFADPPSIPNLNELVWCQFPASTIDALRIVASFLSKEGTWQRGAHFAADKITALNQRSAIEVEVAGLDADEALLSDEFVNYLIKLDTPPDAYAQAPDAMLFRWDNGAWTRAQLLNYEWPAQAERVMDLAGDDAAVEITDEWREALRDAAALSDGQITISPDGLTGRLNSMQVDVEFPTGVERTTKWVADVLEPVFKVIDRWNPDAQTTARFYGKNLRGVVAGVR